MRDIALNATEDFKCWFTRVDTGAPTDCTSIAVSNYPDNSTTQITAGITTTQPFDSVTGYGNVRVVATVANGYAYGSTYGGAVTTGTVNSVSVTGAPLYEFTIRKNTPGLIRAFIAQASTSTTIVFDAATSYADNFLNGHWVVIVAGTGAGQSRFIDTWTNSTDTATVSPAWTTTPDTTSVCECYATPPASTGAPVPANATQILGTAIPTPTVAGVPNVNVKTWNDLTTVALPLIPTTAGRTLDVSTGGEAGVDWANVGSPTTTVGLSGTTVGVTTVATTATNLTNAPTNGDLTATMKTSVTTAASAATPVATVSGDLSATMKTSVTTAATAATPTAAAVTGAVGSVTGNVGGSVASVTSLAGSAGIKKNTAKAAFMFLMTDSTTHAPKTGATVTATRSLDGAAFGACANSVTEVSSGWYKIDLAAGDLNGNTVALLFTASGADNTNVSIVTGA